jgi:hypothetical protein
MIVGMIFVIKLKLHRENFITLPLTQNRENFLLLQRNITMA